MNAVIVDLDGKRAAALCEDGSVREVENLDYSLGQTIVIEEDKNEAEKIENGSKKAKLINYKKWYKKIASAAAIALMLAGIGGASVYAMPYGEVSLDTGTSVTYTINRFDVVLSAKASDEEGEKIIEEVGKENIVNHKIENAVAATLDHIQQEERSDSSLEYQIRTDIGREGSSADEAHADHLQEKLEKVLSDKVPAEEAPKESMEENEGESVMHPDGQPEGSEIHPEEADSENRPDEMPEGESAVSPKADQKTDPENRSEDVMEEKQVNVPAESDNAPDEDAEVSDSEQPQDLSGDQPDERPEGPFADQPGERPEGPSGDQPGGAPDETGPR